jgi:hypothetical protein
MGVQICKWWTKIVPTDPAPLATITLTNPMSPPTPVVDRITVRAVVNGVLLDRDLYVRYE